MFEKSRCNRIVCNVHESNDHWNNCGRKFENSYGSSSSPSLDLSRFFSQASLCSLYNVIMVSCTLLLQCLPLLKTFLAWRIKFKSPNYSPHLSKVLSISSRRRRGGRRRNIVSLLTSVPSVYLKSRSLKISYGRRPFSSR